MDEMMMGRDGKVMRTRVKVGKGGGGLMKRSLEPYKEGTKKTEKIPTVPPSTVRFCLMTNQISEKHQEGDDECGMEERLA